jgi:hypothetical protein
VTDGDDRDLLVVDASLRHLFDAGSAVPSAFTVDVLRRVQEQRWRRERRLDRIFYAGLCAGGVLAIVGLWLAVAAVAQRLSPAAAGVPQLSGDLAMKVTVAALVATVAISWRRLRTF